MMDDNNPESADSKIVVSSDITEHDLRLFIGPEVETYLKFYNRRRLENKIISWHWPVFFVSLVWLFYRKLYIWAFGLLFASIGLALVLPESFVFAVQAMFFALYQSSLMVTDGGPIA